MPRRPLAPIELLVLCVIVLAAVVRADTVQVAGVPNNDVRPRVSANPNTNEYLVAWQHEYSLTDQDVYVRLVRGDGTPQGSEAGVATTSKSEINPDIACNPADNKYLLVYEYEYSDSDHDIFAQLLEASGEVIGGAIAVAVSSSFESMPAVCYSPASNQYLIVWQLRQGGDEFVQNDIYGLWLNADGTAATSAFAIAVARQDESAPALTSGGEGTCLVAWQAKKDGSGDYGIYCRRVANGGSLVGEELAISTWENDQLKPQLAFNTAANEYLLVWEDHHWGWGDDWDIFGRRISEGGVVVGGLVEVYYESANHCEHPDIAWRPATDEYIVTWEFEYGSADHDIYCRTLAHDGTPLTQVSVVSSTSASERVPAVAAGAGASHLVVWEDERNVRTSGIDIYGDFMQLAAISGYVYSGGFGDETTPLPGVTVELYGSNDAVTVGSLLRSTTTDGQGRFMFYVADVWEFYNIITTEQPGFTAAGAATLDGTVVDGSRIRYAAPLAGKDLQSNRFWYWRAPLEITFGPVIQEVSRTRAVVYWQTSTQADSLAEYGSTALFDRRLEDPTPAVIHSLTLGDLEPGTTYRLRVQSKGEFGETVLSRIITLETLPPPDSVPPEISMPNLEFIQADATISPQINDDGQIDRVEFLLDGELIFVDYSAPFEFNFDASRYANGEHILSGRVFDLAGNVSQSDRAVGVATLKDTTLPTVVITSHDNDDHVSGTITVTANLTDDTGIHQALLAVDAYSKADKVFPNPRPKNAPVSLTWDTTDVENGRHRIAVTAYDADWKTGLDTVDVWVDNVPPTPPPKLVITSHTAARHENYFTISVTVKNVGQSEARNIIICDDLLLFQPIAGSTSVADYVAKFKPSVKSSDCIIKSKVAIQPSQSRTYTYNAVAVLVHPAIPVPMIGNSMDLRWDSPTQSGFTDWIQPVVFKTATGELIADAYKNAVKSCDYLIVTSPENLLQFNAAADVDELLSTMAELARLKNGVLGYLYGPASISRNYEGHDGLAVGDVLGDTKEEIVVADVTDGYIYLYAVDSPQWFYLPQDRYFKGGFNQEGFEAGDRVAAGLLPGGTKEKIVMADYSRDTVLVYTACGTLESSFTADLDSHDGLTVGDVHTNVRDEIIIADRGTAKVTTYNIWGVKLLEFSRSYEAYDGFVAGDVLGDGMDEIILADRSADRVYIYSATGLQLGSFPCDFEQGDGLAVANVYSTWSDDKEEIIISDASADAIKVYKANGALLKSITRSVDAFDGLAAGGVFADVGAQILLADYSENSIDIHNFAQNTGDKHILSDLIKAELEFGGWPLLSPALKGTGQWSSKMKDGWVSDGYMLIVGETQIIPAWGDKSLGSVLTTRGNEQLKPDVTDYPYANTYGEETKPELSIGRIIGNTARELTVPIQTSINVEKGTVGYSFDRSFSFTVSGYPAGLSGKSDNIDFKSENFAAAKALIAKGIAHIAMFTPDHTVYNPPGVIDETATNTAVETAFFNNTPNKDVIYLAGHGSATGWDLIHVGEMLAQALPFGGANPFVFVSSCSTGSYHGTTSFAEGVLQRRAGVVLAATRWGLSLHQSIGSYLLSTWDPGESVGKVVRDVKRHIGDYTVPTFSNGSTTTIPNKYERYWTAIYHVFGDPKFGSEPIDVPSPAAGSTMDADEAMSSIDVVVPEYQVDHIDGFDHVEVRGGLGLYVPDKPVVPYYRVSYDYPKGTQIQNVILTARSEPLNDTGLALPMATTAVGSAGAHSVTVRWQGGDEDAGGWWPDKVFEWSVSHSPDATTLTITCFCFNYDAASTDSRFYSSYSFAVDNIASDVEILDVQTDKHTYAPGQLTTIDMALLNSSAEPVDVVVTAIVTDESSDEVVAAFSLRTLRALMGHATFSSTWDTAGIAPGYYRLDVQLSNSEGTVLDTRMTTLRVGSPLVETIELTVAPDYLVPGSETLLSMTVRNAGAAPVSGNAVISVRGSDGAIAAIFDHAFSDLSAFESLLFADTWIPPNPADETYTVTAYVLYDGHATFPRTIMLTRCVNGILPADVNSDCYVDMRDLARMASSWMETQCHLHDCSHADIDFSTDVGFTDLWSLSQQWLSCNDPIDPRCD